VLSVFSLFSVAIHYNLFTKETVTDRLLGITCTVLATAIHQ
jgi:hypothetical protein